MTSLDENDQRAAQRSERWALLRSIDRLLEGPLVILSFIWLAVLIAEFVIGSDTRLDVLFYAIWAVFILEVGIEILIAPDRRAYLRGNWLKIMALAVPALRVLRVLNTLRFLRAARAMRSAGLLRLLTSINRGMAALAGTLDRTRFVYVVALTVLIIVVGAAGMLFFERAAGAGAALDPAMTHYGDALWWTAMTMTTVGTDYFPVTAEGRLLGWLLSVYAIGVFGYVTATMASHFLGLDRHSAGQADEQPLAGEVAALRRELAALRRQLEQSAN